MRRYQRAAYLIRPPAAASVFSPTGSGDWSPDSTTPLRAGSGAVCDAAGTFYEFEGDHLRRLDQVVVDDGGRLFEIRPEEIASEAISSRPLDNQPPKPLRRRIPARYRQTVPSRRSRAEALYDIRGLLGTLPPLRSGGWLRALFGILRLMNAALITLVGWPQLTKWRQLRDGRDLEDQLWAVRPPAGFTHHPKIRKWARRTLESAGYDAESMLIEWEIYWCRRR